MKIELEVIKQIDEEKLAEAKEYVDKNRNISGEIDNIIAKRNRNNDIGCLFSLLQLVSSDKLDKAEKNIAEYDKSKKKLFRIKLFLFLYMVYRGMKPNEAFCFDEKRR